MIRWFKTSFGREIALLAVLALLSLCIGSVRVLAQEWKSGGKHEHAVKPTSPGILFTSIQELKGQLEQDSVLILDARSPALFDQGHLPEAKNLFVLDFNIQFRKNETAIREAQASGTSIVVYCTDRNCPDSMRVAEMLIERGIRPVKIYSGGWREWSSTP